MRLRVLGCHGGESPKHRTSSFLLDDKIAIDAGAVTSMLSLEDQKKVSSVLISHAHLDHIRDLATMADNRCQQDGHTINIAATAGTIDTIKKHFFNDSLWPDFSKINTSHGPTIRYQTLVPEQLSDVDGYQVRAVSVDHTVEAAAFVIGNGQHSVAYSGDTGPTQRLWEVLEKQHDLGMLLMEVSFPNNQHKLAVDSGHHTPETLKKELTKLNGHKNLPVLLFHIKPVFEKVVEKELTDIHRSEMEILRLDDQFKI